MWSDHLHISDNIIIIIACLLGLSAKDPESLFLINE